MVRIKGELTDLSGTIPFESLSNSDEVFSTLVGNKLTRSVVKRQMVRVGNGSHKAHSERDIFIFRAFPLSFADFFLRASGTMAEHAGELTEISPFLSRQYRGGQLKTHKSDACPKQCVDDKVLP